MDIMELGAIGELVGGVAVIGSLLYVGLQVRQSTQQARRQASNEAVANILHASDPCFHTNVELFAKGLQRQEDLTEGQATVFHILIYRGIHQFERIYQQHRSGTVDDDLFQMASRSMRDFMANPGFCSWWDANGQLFRGEFRGWVETLDRGPSREA